MALNTQGTLAGLAILGAGALATRIGRWRHARENAVLQEELLATAAGTPAHAIRDADFEALPPPVARYFRHVLGECRTTVRVARFRQQGRLRAGTDSTRWLPFNATQIVVPAAPGFIWNARVGMMRPLHLTVRDAYVARQGRSQVALQSAWPLAARCGGVEMNSGSLQRYLAEGPWCPTALLPAAGVSWTAIDDNRAMATLEDGGLRIALEFRFNSAGEIDSVYTPGRPRSVKGGYVLTPWEGHFHAYRRIGGLRVPTSGEVGWIVDGRWDAVWKGSLCDIAFEFHPKVTFPQYSTKRQLNPTKGET